ncbi:hypothetical protein HDU76_013335 [Blyttiomyces sp. JEL0837]|nr:hypothetical protein HDU76_013335 [Blyttiomyces sp. JEL0837]
MSSSTSWPWTRLLSTSTLSVTLFFPILLLLGTSTTIIWALDPTDTTTMTGANSRHGYLYVVTYEIGPNTGITLASLTAKKFGLLFDTDLNKVISNAGQIYATPLTYTPPNHPQIIFVVTMENKLFVLDSQNGTVLNSRKLNVPFPISQIPYYAAGCDDITPDVGIVATPVIDPTTSTAYFLAKTYVNSQEEYEFHAVDVLTLQERSGFPVLLNGIVSDNGMVTFSAFYQMNRPGDGGFYTGWIVGLNAATGAFVAKFVTNYDTVPGDADGGAGIWMSGSGLAADDNKKHIYFSTGNSFLGGYTNPTPDQPVLKVGGNAIASVALSQSYTSAKSKIMKTELRPITFFTAQDRAHLDKVDFDLGSGGVILTDLFKGYSNTTKATITIGKDGTMYVLNADHLGGFQQGPTKLDKTLFEYTPAAYVNKFVTPGFGKNRVYVPTSAGHILGFGPTA